MMKRLFRLPTDSTHIGKVIQGRNRERFEDAGLEDWSNTHASQEILAANRSLKRQEADSLREPTEGRWPSQHLFQ